MTEAEELLWPADVAVLASEGDTGPSARTIIHYLSDARRAGRANERGDWHIPEPAGKFARQVETDTPGVYRTVYSPRWRRADIVAWLAARREHRANLARERQDPQTGVFKAAS